MLRYLNNTAQSITPIEWKTILPDGEARPRKYLPFPGLLTKVGDLPSPIIAVAVSDTSESVDNLAQYKTILLQNLSDVDLFFTLNNQDSEVGIPLVKNEIFPITNDCDVDVVKFSGTIGSGSVYVIGVRR